MVGAGAALVDVRPFEDFATGHVPGSLSIALRDQFATWLGWLVPDDRQLVFVVGPEQDRDELITQCLKVDYQYLTGELAGGIGSWAADGRRLATIEVVEPHAVDDRTVLDVRQDAEWASGHLPGGAARRARRTRRQGGGPSREVAGFLLAYAPTWNWVIAANVLLGLNQGLAWSTTGANCRQFDHRPSDTVWPTRSGIALRLLPARSMSRAVQCGRRLGPLQRNAVGHVSVSRRKSRCAALASSNQRLG